MCSKKLSSVNFILFTLLILSFSTQGVASGRNVGSNLAGGGPLTFEQRVANQRAIEEVYWNHRIWPKENPGPKPPLAKVMSDTAIAAKVEDYLRKSNALEQYWNRPITAEQLQAELDRMVKQTKQPAMLKELFESLNNDPSVIAECLARPLLVDRFIHSFYGNDERFHGELKVQAESDLKSYGDAASMKLMSGTYQETLWKKQEQNSKEEFSKEAENSISLDAGEWQGWMDRLQQKFSGPMDLSAMRTLLQNPRTSQKRNSSLPINQLSTLQEDADRFYVIAILEKDNSHVKLATVEWNKRSFDNWWKETSISVPVEIAAPSFAYQLSNSLTSATSCPDDTWVEGGTRATNPPEARSEQTAVWTGSEMIVWGGRGEGTFLFNSGGRYDPSTNMWAWSGTSTLNAPTARFHHTAIWTGKEMIIFGGEDLHVTLNSGGRYDPLTNTWKPTSDVNAKAVLRHTAVWTGTEMIVWGGWNPNIPGNLGGRYDPNTDSWISTSNVNVPQARYGHSAVWTGTEMIVWGGLSTNNSAPLKSGGRYNPSNDTWTLNGTNLLNAPSEREYHTAVWTGTEMIIWGGSAINSGSFNSGGRYSPATDSWSSTSTTNAPSARQWHTSIWTGSEMIIWGGLDNTNSNTGGRYNPSTDTWLSGGTTTVIAPTGRAFHTAIWTGSEMIVWGGAKYISAFQVLDTGGRYNPSTDTWLPSGMTKMEPSARSHPTAVWTGSEMIIWGGSDDTNSLNTGGRYDPVTDTWASTSTTNAPTPRVSPAIWTGTEMIVWGGGPYDQTGGRYNPAANTWAPNGTSTINAPSPRVDYTAIWTGTEMIIWGGDAFGNVNTGGRYNPETDTWFSGGTSTKNAPSPRSRHTAIWTGTEMIVWGGSTYDQTGGRYDPSTNTWVSGGTSTVNAPPGGSNFTAVWTGKEMIIWGGNYYGELNTGGRYNPLTDVWASTSTTDAPTPRSVHTAIWTGTEMIVWGGSGGSPYTNTGGRYNPSTDSWTMTSNFNAPDARGEHTAVWTGSEMIVWGGQDNNFKYVNTGGRYCAVGITPDTVQFTATTYTVAENGGTASITVSRTGAGVISVDYATGDNTATAGSDYTSASGQLNFAAGEASKSFTVSITNDGNAEGNESLNLTLSSPSGAVIGQNGKAVLIISDDDSYTPPTLNFSAVNFTVPESTATKSITVSRTGDTSGTVGVTWSAASNTAKLGIDFSAPGGVLTFGPGVTSQSFTVNITNDTTAERNESGHLILSHPTGGAKLGVRSRAIVTIKDDDVSSSGFKFSNGSYTASESGSKVITITRTMSTTAQSVTFKTSGNGTAAAGVDYTAVTTTVNFAIGQTSKTVNVPILSDTIVERNESVNLTLSSPTGGGTLAAQSRSVLFITDNDSNGTIQFKAASYSVSESGPTATITVTRTGGSYGAVGVRYATTNNTATSGSDYTNSTGTLSFAQGENSKTFTIPIVNDSSVEGTESLNLTLSNPTGGAVLGQIRRAVLTINDND